MLESILAPRGGVLLLAIAAENEARAVLGAIGADVEMAGRAWEAHVIRPRVELVVTGVGKAQAAGGVARVLERERHGLVLSAGVGGALPRGAGGFLKMGTAIAASRSVFADEGVGAGTGFVDLASRGFPPGPWESSGVDVDAAVLAALVPACDGVGAVATVSTCSGTDAQACETARRTGAVVEAMEGAAVAAAAWRLGVRFGEVRVVSNRTGDNPGWELPRALERLGAVLARLTR